MQGADIQWPGRPEIGQGMFGVFGPTGAGIAHAIEDRVTDAVLQDVGPQAVGFVDQGAIAFAVVQRGQGIGEQLGESGAVRVGVPFKVTIERGDALPRQPAACVEADQGLAGLGTRVYPGIGTPLEPRRVTRGFTALLAAADLPKIRLHDLRHSCATLLLSQGVNLAWSWRPLGTRKSA